MSEQQHPAKYKPQWSAAHTRAVERGERHYLDPESGFVVFTELEHRERGSCCGSECRHCPYEEDQDAGK